MTRITIDGPLAAGTYELAPVSAQPAPAPTPAGSMYNPRIYGPGVRINSKGNIRIGPNLLTRVSTRFRASQTSDIATVGLQVRMGSADGYSGGTGGHWWLGVFADDGAGNPGGPALGSTTYNTGQSSGPYNRYPHLALPARGITAGRLYHVVIEDKSATDFASLNLGYGDAPVAGVPRQPAFTDDFGILVYRAGAWTTDGSTSVGSTLRYLPVIDITYANGGHDGSQFHEAMIAQAKPVNSTSWVSERFTARRSFSTTAAAVRLAGSGTLTLDLRDSAGAVIRSGIATLTNGWLRAVYATAPIEIGRTYRLVARGGSYTATPVRAVGNEDAAYGGSGPAWQSYGFAEGTGEFSANSGSTWAPMYAHSPQHLSSYLEVA